MATTRPMYDDRRRMSAQRFIDKYRDRIDAYLYSRGLSKPHADFGEGSYWDFCLRDDHFRSLVSSEGVPT